VREADRTSGPHVIKKVPKAGKAFLIVEEKNTWQEARTACQQIGGDLAKLNNYEDYDLINSFYKSEDYTWFWIGGYQGGTGPDWWENFEWLSGEPIPWKFQYWNTAHPNIPGRKCLVLTYEENGRRNGDTNKNSLASCNCNSLPKGYICEV